MSDDETVTGMVRGRRIKAKRRSSILKMRQADGINDTATEAFIGLPAVVPVLERKTRRVSFADTDKVREFKTFTPDIESAHVSDVAEYTVAKRGVLTDCTDLLQSNILPPRCPSSFINEPDTENIVIANQNIIVHQVEDLDRSRIFSGDYSDSTDSTDMNHSSEGVKDLDLTCVSFNPKMQRALLGATDLNRTVLVADDMDMTTAECGNVFLSGIGNRSLLDVNRTKVFGPGDDFMELTLREDGFTQSEFDKTFCHREPISAFDNLCDNTCIFSPGRSRMETTECFKGWDNVNTMVFDESSASYLTDPAVVEKAKLESNLPVLSKPIILQNNTTDRCENLGLPVDGGVRLNTDPKSFIAFLKGHGKPAVLASRVVSTDDLELSAVEHYHNTDVISSERSSVDSKACDDGYLMSGLPISRNSTILQNKTVEQSGRSQLPVDGMRKPTDTKSFIAFLESQGKPDLQTSHVNSAGNMEKALAVNRNESSRNVLSDQSIMELKAPTEENAKLLASNSRDLNFLKVVSTEYCENVELSRGGLRLSPDMEPSVAVLESRDRPVVQTLTEIDCAKFAHGKTDKRLSANDLLKNVQKLHAKKPRLSVISDESHSISETSQVMCDSDKFRSVVGIRHSSIISANSEANMASCSILPRLTDQPVNMMDETANSSRDSVFGKELLRLPSYGNDAVFNATSVMLDPTETEALRLEMSTMINSASASKFIQDDSIKIPPVPDIVDHHWSNFSTKSYSGSSLSEISVKDSCGGLVSNSLSVSSGSVPVSQQVSDSSISRRLPSVGQTSYSGSSLSEISVKDSCDGLVSNGLSVSSGSVPVSQQISGSSISRRLPSVGQTSASFTSSIQKLRSSSDDAVFNATSIICEPTETFHSGMIVLGDVTSATNRSIRDIEIDMPSLTGIDLPNSFSMTPNSCSRFAAIGQCVDEVQSNNDGFGAMSVNPSSRLVSDLGVSQRLPSWNNNSAISFGKSFEVTGVNGSSCRDINDLSSNIMHQSCSSVLSKQALLNDSTSLKQPSTLLLSSLNEPNFIQHLGSARSLLVGDLSSLPDMQIKNDNATVSEFTASSQVADAVTKSRKSVLWLAEETIPAVDLSSLDVSVDTKKSQAARLMSNSAFLASVQTGVLDDLEPLAKRCKAESDNHQPDAFAKSQKVNESLTNAPLHNANGEFDEEEFFNTVNQLEKTMLELDAALDLDINSRLTEIERVCNIDKEIKLLTDQLSTKLQLKQQADQEFFSLLSETSQFLMLEKEWERDGQKKRTEALQKLSKYEMETEVLMRILPWTVNVWDWDKRASFCFLGGLLSLHLEFGPELPDLHFQSRPARVISNIALSTAEPDENWTCERHLMLRLIQESVNMTKIRQALGDMTQIPEALWSIGTVVNAAKRITDDIGRINHNVKIDGHRLSVTFSSVISFSKFILDCEVHMPAIMHSAPVWSFTNLIGNISESDIMQVVGATSPGVSYLGKTFDVVRGYLSGKRPAHKLPA